MADPLLDLTTLTERPTITIDGVRYEILSFDELSVVDTQRFQSWGKRLGELTALPDLTDKQAAELVEGLHRLTDRIMVGVPEDIRAGLTDSHRIAVAEVFMRLPRQAKAARKGRTKKPGRSTGAKRRRGSNASTAATPPGG